jgi:hypothetical protein
MKCKAVIKEIEEMEMSASLPVEVSAHLPVCESCRAFAEERAALRLLVGTLDKVSAPADFDWRLKARLAEARSERVNARRFLPGFAPGPQAVTLAACVTLLLVAVVVYRQTRPITSNETQSIAGANTKEDAGKESERKGLPVVSKQASGPDSVSESKQPSASNDSARTRNIKSARANKARTESSRETLQRERIFSNDMASRGAEEITSKKAVNAARTDAPVISVSLPSATSARLRVEDGQGTRRTLSPINFGGQELIERPARARLVPASEKGIW